MKNHILFADALTMSEKISVSATTVVLGMLTVFAVLTLIMIVLTIIGKFFEKKDGKSKNAEPARSASVVSEPTPAAPMPVAPVTTTDDAAVIAAISAAIAVYIEQPIGSFRVVSYRKTSTKTAWNKK